MNQQQRRSPRRGGFTLTEVLVTIGIIVVIISILIPVVSGVRDKARAADTANQIMSLASAITRYEQDFRAYPGPLANNQIGTGATNVVTLTNMNPTGFETGHITSDDISGAENLVLGLLGGLRMNGTTLEYHPDQIGNGPFSLSLNNPKKYTPYIDNINLSWRENAAMARTGDFNDGADGIDSRVPEFVDRFPAPMPILYLRANKGSAVPLLAGEGAQYNLNHILAYTTPDSPGISIGNNKKLAPGDHVGDGKSHVGEHGLQAVTRAPAPTMKRYDSSGNPDPNFHYPYYYALPYFTNPNMPATVRQKDEYILISAGVDRVYGTEDDICNFGAVAP